ncbi:uncharacterized protein LOC142627928 [Castanea sativa]|uniref:uncharacterized protein LOC142627928 n=1 Tax=Castanea sativa TaxID=21020 RepID=UPI003F64A548
MPQVESYDGSKDPLGHLESFKTIMHLQGVLDEIMYRAIPTRLKGPARIWYSRLTPNSISTFKELGAQFVSHFIGAHRYKKFTACLMSIRQWEDETLRSYIARFNKEALSIDEADDKILMATFTNRLWKVLYRVTKYMNAEDALLAREKKPRKRERQEDTRLDKGRKMARTGERWEDRHSKPPIGKFTSFTPLTAPIDQVLMQIKDEKALTFLCKLRGDPNKRSRDKYCRFHRDHGHDTADCYDLIVQKSSQNLFTGSSERTADEFCTKMARINNPIIGFSEEDARCLHHPHDDALVVSIRAGDYNMHRVLVDNGSLVDILYYPAFQQMGISIEQLVPKNTPLVCFGGTRVYPFGVVTLFVTVGDHP